MNKRTLLVGLTGLLVMLLLAGVAWASSSASFDLSWRVLAGGGGRSASTTYAMNSTLGQAVAGYSCDTQCGIQSGYWQSWLDQRVYLPSVLRSFP